MVYATRLANSGPWSFFLKPACFESGGGYLFSPENMPMSARKFSTAGEAAIYCESLPFTCEVVAVGPGREYESPGLAPGLYPGQSLTSGHVVAGLLVPANGETF